MKALRFYDQRKIVLEEIEKPKPCAGEVLLKVTDCGLCQTQVNEFAEGPYVLNDQPHPLTSLAIPLVMGHEFGGIIEAVGENVSPEMIGRKAAVMPLLSCGHCKYCQSGRENLCDQFAYYGLLGANGGFTQYAVVKEENIVFVEESSLLTFIEPVLVAIHAATKIRECRSSNRILILGAGAIGVTLAAILRDYCNCSNVFINDVLPNRLERAKSCGFMVIGKEQLSEEKFDVVYDCAGNDPMSQNVALIQGFELLEKGGTLIGLGSYFHPLSIVPIHWIMGETTIINSFAYNRQDVAQLQKVLKILQIDFESLCENIQLENIIEDGFYRSEIDKDSFTRLVVKC